MFLVRSGDSSPSRESLIARIMPGRNNGEFRGFSTIGPTTRAESPRTTGGFPPEIGSVMAKTAAIRSNRSGAKIAA
jgi:hypothetical protein